LQIYYDRTHFEQPKPTALFEPAGIFQDDLDTCDLDFQHHLRLLGRNNLVWGFGYRFTHDVAGAAPSLAFVPPVLDQNLFNVFVQNEFALTEKLFLTGGTKAEHNDYTGFEVEPGARLQWNLATNQMLWTSVSRAVRTPSRIDRDLVEPTGLAAAPTLLAGGTNFQSETLLAYELGYRTELSRDVSVSLSTYYNDYNNVRSASRSPAPAPFGLPIVFENNLKGNTYGGELAATWQVVENIRIHGSYQLLKEDIHVKPGTTDINNALNETADPEQQFSLRSSVELGRDVDLDGGLRWVDRLIANNSGAPMTVPSYFELDARLAWRPFKNLEMSLVGQNLLHGHHLEYFNGAPTQEAIQRAVYAKMSWRF
jgi:iron complex outermembrane receptor protein